MARDLRIRLSRRAVQCAKCTGADSRRRTIAPLQLRFERSYLEESHIPVSCRREHSGIRLKDHSSRLAGRAFQRHRCETFAHAESVGANRTRAYKDAYSSRGVSAQCNPPRQSRRRRLRSTGPRVHDGSGVARVETGGHGNDLKTACERIANSNDLLNFQLELSFESARDSGTKSDQLEQISRLCRLLDSRISIGGKRRTSVRRRL